MSSQSRRTNQDPGITRTSSQRVSQRTKQVASRTNFGKNTTAYTAAANSTESSKKKSRKTSSATYQKKKNPAKNSQSTWQNPTTIENLQATIARVQRKSILTTKDRALLRTLVALPPGLQASLVQPSSGPPPSVKDQVAISAPAMSSVSTVSKSDSPSVCQLPSASLAPTTDTSASSSSQTKSVTELLQRLRMSSSIAQSP